MSKVILSSLPAAELGVDSPEIRELFLSKIYDLSNPTRNMDDMQDDFCCEYY